MPANSFRHQASTSEALAQKLAEVARQRRSSPNAMWGVAPYGFPTLDRWTGGIQQDDMIIVAARPNVGKSAWAGQVAESAARHFKQSGSNKWVKVVTTEMSGEQCLSRLACSRAGLDPWKVKSGYTTDLEYQRYQQALRYFARLPIEYLGAQVSVEELYEFITHGNPCGLWVLDHVGLIAEVTSAATQVWAAMTTVSKKLQQICRRGYPGIVVAHLNRSAESRQDKRPQLSDLATSDQLGRDADIVVGLHRPQLYMQLPEDMEGEPEVAEVIVLKGRDTRTGSFKAYWYPQFTLWKESEDSAKKAAQENDNGAAKVAGFL